MDGGRVLTPESAGALYIAPETVGNYGVTVTDDKGQAMRTDVAITQDLGITPQLLNVSTGQGESMRRFVGKPGGAP